MAQKMHVKKGDTVRVIAGKDLGKRGKILEVIPDTRRVIVEGVNVVHRHTRPTRELPQGGIVENEAPVNASNVQLICPRCSKNSRVGRQVLDSGKKVRICRKCNEVIDK